MLNIVLYGCNGAMGRETGSLIFEEKDVCVCAGVDSMIKKAQTAMPYMNYPVFKSLYEIDSCIIDKADVIIDFSTAQAADSLLDFVEKKHIPLVMCTTGLKSRQLKKVEDISLSSPILRSANMSLGINLLTKLVAEAAKTLYDSGFDIEIIEKHHRRKLDAPSGTALLLADSIDAELNNRLGYIYDRSGRHEPRHDDEIGISSVRGGGIVGEHEVIFAGMDEVVSIKHTAFSRRIFAQGALKAAIFLLSKSNGLYSMNDVINSSYNV